MKHRAISLIVAAYILLCILLGGSSQSAWPGLALQLLGIGLIAWAAIERIHTEGHSRPIALYAILIFGLLIVFLQLVPLPPNIWTKLPGHQDILQGMQVLGFQLPWTPISQVPYVSILTLFAIIPPIAAFVLIERLSPSPRGIALGIVVGMALGTFLGALQTAGGPDSSAYLYPIHNAGAVGFFANHNHMATLLLVSIPMAAALIVSAKSERRKTAMGRYGFGAALLILILVGIALTGSRAAIALSVPVIFASATLFAGLTRWRGMILGLSAVALAAAVVVVAIKPIAISAADSSTFTSISRGEIWGTTAHAVRDSFPVGTGLGSFDQIYHRYENAEDIDRSYVNHVHNDYLEFILELGAGGLLLIIAFLGWWLIATARIWTSSLSTPFARASTIATAAILAQSFVDFPMRTEAMSAVFAACVGIMASHLRPVRVKKPGEIRPTKHVTIR